MAHTDLPYPHRAHPVPGDPDLADVSAPISVPEILAGAAKTFAERQAVYSKDGPGFEKHGKILAVLFPNGVKFDDPVQFTRWVLFNNVLTKVCRYAENMGTGGHLDSVHDIGVYAFILEAHDRNARSG